MRFLLFFNREINRHKNSPFKMAIPHLLALLLFRPSALRYLFGGMYFQLHRTDNVERYQVEARSFDKMSYRTFALRSKD